MTRTMLVEKLVCTVRGCNRPQQGRGLCITHYMRLWRVGFGDKKAADRSAAPSAAPKTRMEAKHRGTSTANSSS